MNEKDVGENIRKIRTGLQISLTEVALKAGLSKGALSKIENGSISSPVSTLFNVASALGVPLSEFFKQETQKQNYIVTRKGKGTRMVRSGSQFGYAYEALASYFPGRPVEPFILTIRPEDRQTEFRHGGHEFIYVLSGRMIMSLGNEKIQLDEGDFIYFDPSQKHSCKVLGKKPIRFLCCLIQTGKEKK